MVKGAARRGLDVNDFIQEKQAWPRFLRQAEEYADRLVESGALSAATGCVVEIGAGSGRHARVIKRRFPGLRYIAYEADPVWRDVLRKNYGLETEAFHGELLPGARDGSVDLLHAVLTFVYLPFLSVVSYLNEAARVVKSGGFLHFDVYVEDSFPPAQIAKWLSTPDRYPTILPRQFLIQLLQERGFSLVREALEPDHGTFEFLFRKN
jgi:SAM-dependent methyltransferase